jgi:hypothetical protein
MLHVPAVTLPVPVVFRAPVGAGHHVPAGRPDPVVPRVPAADRPVLAVGPLAPAVGRPVLAVGRHDRVADRLVPAVGPRVPAAPDRAARAQEVEVGARVDVVPAARSAMLLARPRTRKRKPRNRPSSSRER